MKKLLISLLMATTTITLFSAAALAASEPDNEAANPFTGQFSGTVYGDENSETTLTLDLIDEDTIVSGTASLDGGLLVDAGGMCGSVVLPASSMWAEGETSAKNPNELTAEAKIDVSAFTVTVAVTGELSTDGETLEVEAEIDTPWICGRDPVIMGTLTKVS